MAGGKNFARGIYMQGDHSSVPEPAAPTKAPWLSVPIDFPEIALNRLSVGVLNTLYYNKQFTKRKTGVVDYEPFFYPLDSILHWNKIYGRSGLLQFQCLIPWEDGPQEGIVRILKASQGRGWLCSWRSSRSSEIFRHRECFLFPKPGITLALDFPIREEVSFDLLDRLANITLDMMADSIPLKMRA